jgi:hypothetical protein
VEAGTEAAKRAGGQSDLPGLMQVPMLPVALTRIAVSEILLQAEAKTRAEVGFFIACRKTRAERGSFWLH